MTSRLRDYSIEIGRKHATKAQLQRILDSPGIDGESDVGIQVDEYKKHVYVVVFRSACTRDMLVTATEVILGSKIRYARIDDNVELFRDGYDFDDDSD